MLLEICGNPTQHINRRQWYGSTTVSDTLGDGMTENVSMIRSLADAQHVHHRDTLNKHGNNNQKKLLGRIWGQWHNFFLFQIDLGCLGFWSILTPFQNLDVTVTVLFVNRIATMDQDTPLAPWKSTMYPYQRRCRHPKNGKAGNPANLRWFGWMDVVKPEEQNTFWPKNPFVHQNKKSLYITTYNN